MPEGRESVSSSRGFRALDKEETGYPRFWSPGVIGCRITDVWLRRRLTRSLTELARQKEWYASTAGRGYRAKLFRVLSWRTRFEDGIPFGRRYDGCLTQSSFFTKNFFLKSFATRS